MGSQRTFGYHIAGFLAPGSNDVVPFNALVDQARAADRSGFDRVHVMDHLYQIPPAGRPHDPMLEAYTTLAALAQHTESVDVAALVTGVPYRNPALLGKIVATLDYVSGGRAQLGLGASWFEVEQQAFGFEVEPNRRRLDRLQEALRILRPMLDPDPGPVTHDGEFYQTDELVNSPPPSRRTPIIIGGDGERRTLRIAAEFADESNFLSPVDQVPRKLDALAAHCQAVGRPRDEIRVTHLTRVLVAPTTAEAEADFEISADARAMPDPMRDVARTFLTIGDPDTVGEELQRRLDLGLDGLTISLNVNGHNPERIELLGQVVSALR
jgi:F420-dependent oxidoreductase-like protein